MSIYAPDNQQAWTAVSATTTGWSSTTVNSMRYCVIGKAIVVSFNITGTSNSTSSSMNLPFTANSAANMFWEGALGFIQDNGANPAGMGRYSISSSGTTVSFFKDNSGTAWTGSGSKIIRGVFVYEAA